MTLITSDGGLSEDHPDDTVAAFVAAVAEGADRLELDIHLTRDGHLVVHHPYYLGQGNTAPQYPSTRHDIPRILVTVSDLTLDELRGLDAGNWAGAAHTGATIPTLEEVVAACPGVGLELDLKTPSKALVAGVVDLVRTAGLLERVELTSSQHFLLAEVHRLEPAAELGTFHYGYPEFMDPSLGESMILGELDVGDLHVMHCALDLLNPPFIARARQAGHLVYASNCETPDQLERAYALGVDRLSTTRLKLALKVRAEHRASEA